jgi:hypothetical protein
MSSNTKDLSRREFSVAAALAALSGVAITISSAACGGGSSSSPSPVPTPTPAPTPTPSAGDKTGTISSNHGHTAVITGAQLTAAADLVLDIRGSSDHPHSVTLSGAEVASIAGGQRVSKESSSDAAHSHTVTFN